MLKNMVHGFNRYFGRPEVVVLLSTLVGLMLLFAYLGQLLAPVFASIVVAYLLQWPINRLERLKVPHALAVLLIYSGFVAVVVLSFSRSPAKSDSRPANCRRNSCSSC